MFKSAANRIINNKALGNYQ